MASTPAAHRAPRYELVQALRALAALTVAFGHIAHDMRVGAPAAPGLDAVIAWLPWDAGVDVFFVISGFVIAVSSRRFFATADGPRQFLIRRIARIVPIYWAATLLFLAITILLPGTTNASLGGPWYLLAGLLFLPAARPDGLVQPPLGLGWTLNYEMFFYLAFAPFLWLPRLPAMLGACAALGGLVLLSAAGLLPGVMLNFWASPLTLEFCAGLLLALLAGQVRLTLPPRLLLVVAAIALLHLGGPELPRLLHAGLPALLLVAAASLAPPSPARGPAMALAARLGDASYALYLLHPFVMRPVQLLWRALHFPGGAVLPVLASLLLAALLALAAHTRFERPVTARLRRWLDAGGATVQGN